MRRTLAIALTLCAAAWPAEAFAWGCEGHQAIAALAERLLSAGSLKAVKAMLAASPVDPSLRRGCPPVPSDSVAEAATWADDQRAVEPATGSWHFVNLPRSLGAGTADITPYCRGGGCIIDAITTQLAALNKPGDPARQARALRFVIHLVGDIHQPLHVITNGDRGGNCFPVAYFARSPETDDRGNISPNLHGVWDSSVIAALMKAHGLADARALAAYLAAPGAFPQTVAARLPTRTDVTSWAREANALARAVAYGRLPVAVPMEPAGAQTLTSCTDNRDVAHRLLMLHEHVTEPYEQAAEAVIVSQLRLAGTRLAAALQSVFPGR